MELYLETRWLMWMYRYFFWYDDEMEIMGMAASSIGLYLRSGDLGADGCSDVDWTDL